MACPSKLDAKEVGHVTHEIYISQGREFLLKARLNSLIRREVNKIVDIYSNVYRIFIWDEITI